MTAEMDTTSDLGNAPGRITLTQDVIRKLRAPFEPEQIKWKIQTSPRDGEDMAIVVAYVDARDVNERLDSATGGDWAASYTEPPFVLSGEQIALMCHLTVGGVTRSDIGTADRSSPEAAKEVVSDAFKRASVMFGVGAHLYRFPRVKARVERVGRGTYLTFKAQDELLQLNRCLLSGKPMPRFAEVKVFGSAFGAAGRDLFGKAEEEEEAEEEAVEVEEAAEEPRPTTLREQAKAARRGNNGSNNGSNGNGDTIPAPDIEKIRAGAGLIRAMPNGQAHLSTLCNRFGIESLKAEDLAHLRMPRERLALFLEELRALWRELDALQDVEVEVPA